MVINSFNVTLSSLLRRPLLARFNWDIGGKWSYLIINTGAESFRVDSVHDQIWYNKLQPSQRYNLSVDVYNADDEIIQTKSNIIIRT